MISIVSPRAARDISDAAEYYNSQQTGLGLKFVETVEATYKLIESTPKAGSTRYMHLLPSLELRVFMVKAFPFLVFYIERSGVIRIERVLHAHRDLPKALHETSS